MSISLDDFSDYDDLSSSLLYYANSLFEPSAYCGESVVRMMSTTENEGGAFCSSKTAELAYRVFLGISLIPMIPIAAITGIVGMALHSIGVATQRHSCNYLRGNATEKEFNGTLKLGQLNICGIRFSRVFGGVIDPAHRIDRIAEKILQEDPDIVCLSEVHLPSLSAVLNNKLKDRYAHFVYSICPTYHGADSGLYIASKYEISDIQVQAFRSSVGINKMVNKGYVAMNVIGSDGVLGKIIATHLQPDDEPEEIEARRDNFSQIQREQLDPLASPDWNLQEKFAILTGDLNLNQVDRQDLLVGKFQDPFSGEDDLITYTEKLRKYIWNPENNAPDQRLDFTLRYQGEAGGRVGPDKIQTEARQVEMYSLNDPENGLSDHKMQITTVTIQA